MQICKKMQKCKKLKSTQKCKLKNKIGHQLSKRIELRFVLLLLLLLLLCVKFAHFCTLDKNSYNLAIYQARTSRFWVVVDLDNTHGLYHAIPYHTIAYQTIPNRTKGISALGVGRDLGVSREHQTISYHTIPYCTKPNHNNKFLKVSKSFR